MKKTVIVTGGSRGIGAGIVQFLAEENKYNIILNYNKSEESAKKIKEELNSKGINIEIFKADVSKREEVKRLVDFVLNKFGHITDEDWNNMMQNNLYSVFYCSQEVISNMIHNKQGCIINISSIWGVEGGSCEVHYSTAKAGIIGLTKALAKEVGPSNIRVNCIAPGMIDTDMNKEYLNEDIQGIIDETPLAKIGTPIDIARCAKWLIEDEFTTAQVISINGGWS